MSESIAEPVDTPDLPVPDTQAAQARANAIRWWQERGLPIDAKPRTCLYCKHEYLRPCDESDHAKCMNFTHLYANRAT